MKVNGPTPSGGDYSEVFYFDGNDNVVSDSRFAVRGVIRECTEDGVLIATTWFTIGDDNE